MDAIDSAIAMDSTNPSKPTVSAFGKSVPISPKSILSVEIGGRPSGMVPTTSIFMLLSIRVA